MNEYLLNWLKILSLYNKVICMMIKLFLKLILHNINHGSFINRFDFRQLTIKLNQKQYNNMVYR